jgi:hypothetical protein
MLGAVVASGAELHVGPGQRFDRPETALKAARDGDTIRIHPQKDNAPYTGVALFVRQSRLTISAVRAEGDARVKLSGQGFDYSGRGSVPRAIVQFNRGADGCLLEGFELYGATNKTHNGAGVRINQANNVTVRDCEIRSNDMGVMSNGDGTAQTGVNQLLERCRIHHNGNHDDPGYNHNLYLGGTSVTLRFCDVHHSLTGHNVKSRAHVTRLLYCYVHDSANRELDLVDARDTTRPNSDALLMGCIVVKDPACKGNRAVMHFGQDGGREHDGTLHLVYNTIVTPFVSPVVTLSAPKARAELIGNLIVNPQGRGNQTLFDARKGADLQHATGTHNWVQAGFGSLGQLAAANNALQQKPQDLFVRPAEHDYRLRPSWARRLALGLPAERIELPRFPAYVESAQVEPLTAQYVHPADGHSRRALPRPILGAHGRAPTDDEASQDR